MATQLPFATTVPLSTGQFISKDAHGILSEASTATLSSVATHVFAIGAGATATSGHHATVKE